MSHPSNSSDVKALFTYQRPDAGQVQRMMDIREKAKILAFAILAHCPECADRSAATRKLREAVMTANAAIVLED